MLSTSRVWFVYPYICLSPMINFVRCGCFYKWTTKWLSQQQKYANLRRKMTIILFFFFYFHLLPHSHQSWNMFRSLLNTVLNSFFHNRIWIFLVQWNWQDISYLDYNVRSVLPIISVTDFQYVWANKTCLVDLSGVYKRRTSTVIKINGTIGICIAHCQTHSMLFQVEVKRLMTVSIPLFSGR